jgi:hypothetical protein
MAKGSISERTVRNRRRPSESLDQLLKQGNLTFYKKFEGATGVNADYNLGSGVGTFTRVACNCTYTDSNGVIQLVSDANTPRFQGGYYDTTGFHSQPGLMIEGSAGSGLDNMLVRTDGTASGSGLWTGWSVDDNFAGSENKTVVSIPELTSITNATAQRIQYTASVGDSNGYIYIYGTTNGNGTTVNGDKVTVSSYLKAGETQSGVDVNIGFYSYDSNGIVVGSSSNSSTLTLTTSWSRYSYSTTAADVTATISSIDGDATTITVDTSSAHGISDGALVVISGTTNYNGTYTVDSITDSNTFTIADTDHNLDAEVAGTVTNPVNKVRFRIRIGSVSDEDIIDTYIALPQCEERPYATSYVPTAGTLGTRNADILTYPITGNRTAATESIFIKFSPCSAFANDGVVRQLIGTDTKSVTIRKATTGTTCEYFPNITDSIGTKATSTTNILANTSYTIAGIAYGETAGTNAELYINGTSEGTDSDNYTAPAWGTNFFIGSSNGSLLQLNGVIQSVAIFSDAKNLTSVSSITNILNS